MCSRRQTEARPGSDLPVKIKVTFILEVTEPCKDVKQVNDMTMFPVRKALCMAV